MKMTKPVLHGLSVKRGKMAIIYGIASSIVTGLMWQFGVAERRKERYKKFYENYDSDKEFETMRKKGLFDSC